MDGFGVAVIAIFALVVVAVIFVYRDNVIVRIKGLFGMGLEVEGRNPVPPQTKPAVNIEDATSRGGGIVADDQVGEGVNIRRVDVQDDILASSRKGDADPKV